ncbi:MAG: hypothetical protein D6775_12910 [Caldilineae bacterium]|nr:MAG: hypothetical protein D6775_12910 [Caldilineae bacterium]
MTILQAYHRPRDLDTALRLLARSDVRTAVLAGGIHLNPHRPEDVIEVVDLQDLELEGVRRADDRIAVGAMTRLQALVEDETLPELIRICAHRSGPNTFRNQGTIGGVVVGADPESELLAALLVHEAEVTVRRQADSQRLPLAAFLEDIAAAVRGGLVTEITFASTGAGAVERVARTPADKPIVAAVARRRPDGTTLLALCGVAPTPILLDSDQIAELRPPADFRGSSEYRREMARVLSRRALQTLQSSQGD